MIMDMIAQCNLRNWVVHRTQAKIYYNIINLQFYQASIEIPQSVEIYPKERDMWEDKWIYFIVEVLYC